MRITDMDRGTAQAFAQKGWLNLTHYDVCRALESGKTLEEVAEMFHFKDFRSVRYIRQKCAECK